jgi:hypothetical protein
VPSAAPPTTAPDTAAQAVRATPLPALDESDAEVVSGLTELLGGREPLQQFLVPQRIIRNVVVTLDNLPREKIAVNQRPAKPTGGKFIVTGPEEAREIAPENYTRYAQFVAVVKRVDAKTLAAFYRGLQPLFQQSYEELGNPGASFDAASPGDRPPLQTPDVTQPVTRATERLMQMRGPARASRGTEALIRMGPENETAVKAKLRELRAALG